MKLSVSLKNRLLIALLSMLPIVSANAALIDNGNTTLDTESGFSWLDLTETVGLLPLDIFNGALGLLDAGWMVASGSQVDSLFESAGARVPGAFPQNYDTPDVPLLLLETLGQTGVAIPLGQISGQGWALNSSGLHSAPAYAFQPPDQHFTIGSFNEIPGPFRDSEIGVFLYRDASNSIPLPSTAVLLLACLAIIKCGHGQGRKNVLIHIHQASNRPSTELNKNDSRTHGVGVLFHRARFSGVADHYAGVKKGL